MNFDLKEDLASDNSTVNDVAESKGVEIDLNAEPDFLAYVLSEGSVQSDIKPLDLNAPADEVLD